MASGSITTLVIQLVISVVKLHRKGDYIRQVEIARHHPGFACLTMLRKLFLLNEVLSCLSCGNVDVCKFVFACVCVCV